MRVEMEPIHPFRITDMIRASISVDTTLESSEEGASVANTCDLIKVYNILNTCFNQSIQIIRIKNKLNTSMQNVTLNFIW